MIKIVRMSEVRERKRMRIMAVVSVVVVVAGSISMYEFFDYELNRILYPTSPVTNNTSTQPKQTYTGPPKATVTTSFSDSGADIHITQMKGNASWNNTSLTVTWDSGTETWYYSYAVGRTLIDGGYNLTESGNTPIGGYATVGTPFHNRVDYGKYLGNDDEISINLVPGISHFSLEDTSTHTVIASGSAS